MKKLFKKYGATVIFYSGIIAIFVLGFVLGAYGRSAPDAETADFYNDKIKCEAASGTAVETASDEAAQHTEYTEITVTATAYCPCEYCTDGDGITATGTQATAGRTIAVDPSVIPYGTEVIINGHTYIAEDCGAAIKGNCIDIYFNSHEEARQFGRQTIIATFAN